MGIMDTACVIPISEANSCYIQWGRVNINTVGGEENNAKGRALRIVRIGSRGAFRGHNKWALVK